MRLFIKWLVCAGVLLLTSILFPGSLILSGGAASLIACATVLWLFNLFLRPVFQLLALPLTLVTLGLFSLVVNGLLVALSAALIPGLVIHGFGVCLFVALLIAAGNLLFAHRTHLV